MSNFNLTPLKQPSEPKKFAVCDIESAGWTKFLVIGFFDGKTFLEFRDLLNFFNYLFTTEIETVFAHFGGIFDFLFLIQELLGQEKITITKIIPRGSGILLFSISRADKKQEITFYDSSAMLPFSLKKLTDSFNVPTKKQSIDYTRIKKVTPRLLEYLKADCIGLFQVIQKYFNSALIVKAGPKFTIASQALQIFRTYLEKPIECLGQGIDQWVRQAYVGGRTEIFRPLYSGKKPLYCYDVNSLYPTAMLNEMPNECEGFSRKLDMEKMGFIEARVYVPENTYVPFLWAKSPIDNKFIFPTGEFKGTWSTLELNHALKQGVRILEFGKKLYFKNGGKIFEKFVTEHYNFREKSHDETEKIIAKLILNSLYGRMGIKRDREGIEFDNGQENVTPYTEFKLKNKTVRFVKTDVRLKSFSNVAIAAYITAHSRIIMHRLLNEVKETLYYTDTDSLFTTARMPTGTGLGALKLEYECNRACFLLPKTYIAGTKIAMKGFDKKKITHFTIDDFENALEGDLKAMHITQDAKITRFKTGLKKNNLLHLQKPGIKRIQSVYNKREIFFDEKSKKWDSRPINLK